MQRDYDKEPLIIKSYERFFVYNLFVFPFLFALTIALSIRSLFDKYETISGVISFGIMMIFILSSEFIITYILYVENSKSTIHFKNNSIEFYDGLELKSVTYLSNVENYICKPFFTNWHLGNDEKIIKYVALIAISYLILRGDNKLAFIALFICFYIGILIVKILVFYKLNGNLKGFTPFLNIVIDMPKTTGSQSGLNKSLNAEYYMIYMADMDKYLEIKKYFLTRKNINIDKIRKECL
ncbi:MAG: hypothetical protein II923_05795 [Campylobacter sp.]|nr:hypothetical protein [Campylobacter sp.]